MEEMTTFLDLHKRLELYRESQIYPFHMPGHKRQMMKMGNPYEIDITEIDGFDDLHHSEGILKKAMEEAAEFYGSDATYFLVNGSTCGILAAVFAAVGPEGKLIMARNSHKSLYNGVLLGRMEPVYVYPDIVDDFDIYGGISPKKIEELLITHPDAKAVCITSPTYEGIVSDIKEIARVCHKYNRPLVVDEAHGAHLGMGEGFPASALTGGADLVIQSLHKTLPSLTQTALLHMKSSLVEKDQVEKYLSIFQTSSPSYILLSSIEDCIGLMIREGRERMREYNGLLSSYRDKLSFELKNLNFLDCKRVKGHDIFQVDPSKILVSTKGCSINGPKLSSLLLRRYKLQMEMCTDSYILGMTSLADSKEGFDRLVKALGEIDGEVEGAKETKEERISQLIGGDDQPERIWIPGEADRKEKEYVALEESGGQISGAYVYIYPPGVPILVPGEKISTKSIDILKRYQQNGMDIHGLKRENRICVLKY